MKARFLFIFAAMVPLLLASQTRYADLTIFVGVGIVSPEEGNVQGPFNVVIQGDRIVAVGKTSEMPVPTVSRVIRSSGKYMLPGLAELHGHIPPPDADPQYIEDVLFLYVANGITTVRGMLGAPNQLELRETARRSEIVSPTLYLAGPSFNSRSINSPQEAVKKVRDQEKEGWDLLKVHPGLTLEEYDAMARTAHELGIPFAGHVPSDVGLPHALEMKQQTIDHLDGYIEHLGGFQAVIPDEKLQEVAELTKQAGAWVVPTMALWETLLGVSDLATLESYPELRYMPPRVVEAWARSVKQRQANPGQPPAAGKNAAANRLRLLKTLSDAGAGILLGTDAPQIFSVPGFSIHREIAKMKEAGMGTQEIIRSATSSVGRYFADKDKFGQIAVGQRADMLILDGNPLDDLSNLSKRVGVMVRGHWFSESFIQERLEKIARRHLEETGDIG